MRITHWKIKVFNTYKRQRINQHLKKKEIIMHHMGCEFCNPFFKSNCSYRPEPHKKYLSRATLEVALNEQYENMWAQPSHPNLGQI